MGVQFGPVRTDQLTERALVAVPRSLEQGLLAGVRVFAHPGSSLLRLTPLRLRGVSP